MTRFANPSWEDMDKGLSALAELLTPVISKKNITTLCAVTRGGMVPAAILARQLRIHHIETICINSYLDCEKQNSSQIIKMLDGDGTGVLVIDDLVDSGKTMKIVKDHLPKATTAVLFAKPQGKPFADYFLKELPQDLWVCFPWETTPPEALGKDFCGITL